MELLAFGNTGWGDELFYATLMTLAVSITAMIIGFFFALIFTPLKLSKHKSLNLIGNFYTTVVRGVPELLIIYLLFFGGSGAVMFVASIFGYNEYIEINAFITGAFAIGIISGAYSTEVFRGAIQSIDRGHISRFLLVCFIIAIPPSIVDLTSTIRKTSTVRKRKKPNRKRKLSKRKRRFA